jgi:hypothetical protein
MNGTSSYDVKLYVANGNQPVMLSWIQSGAGTLLPALSTSEAIHVQE